MANTGFSNQTLGRLCRSLALLLHSGISLADSLYLLAQEEKDPLRQALQAMGKAMDEGCALSQAAESTHLFPHHMVGMLRIGERTGKTEEALEALADSYDARHRAGKLLKSAVAYPSLILLLMLAVIGVLLTQVLPIFDQVYASLGSRLTGIAAGLLHAGTLLQAALPALLVILAVLVAAVLLLSVCNPLRERVSRFFRAKLGDRGLSRRFCNARFARAFSMGLSSGLSPEESLELAGQLLADTPGAQARCRRCGELLEADIPLGEALTQTQLLPAAAGRMLAVGLRGGNADQVMAALAGQLEEDAEDALTAAVGRAEPAMVLAASVLVGVILLSVMLPLLHILSAIG